MIILISCLAVFLVVIFAVFIIFGFKTQKKYKEKSFEHIQELLQFKNFDFSKIVYVNKYLTLASNFDNSKLAIIKNFNPKSPENYDYEEIGTNFIEEIQKFGNTIKIFYLKKGSLYIVDISPVTREVNDFIHETYKGACAKKIEEKFIDNNFTLSSASDWNCSYLWAYSPKTDSFAYFKTGKNPILRLLKLTKEFFTIDLKYRYFETKINGIPQQLFVYEKEFLDNLYNDLRKKIKQKTTLIKEDMIYFDNYSNVIYLFGNNVIQSVLIDMINDVSYRDKSLVFDLKNSQRIINFNADNEFIEQFEDFVTNYNLNKISKNFDHKSDVVLNTTLNTKFIFDTSRSRAVYCANLNKFDAFSFMSIPYNNFEDVTVEKSASKYFVRIYTREKEIIDITCNKHEVANFIEAQIKNIMFGK